jgi:DNA end-binding protein Ku
MMKKGNSSKHAIWNGSINFGLVNIPVRMYSGSDNHQGLDLDMLHKTDHSPIRYARICRKDHSEVPFNQIVKGYQYAKGKYVILANEDFEKANLHKTKNIEIQQFVKENDIDTRYYIKPYYLEPEEKAETTYALLREALHKSTKVALAKYVLHGHESLAVIRPIGKALVLNQLRWPADVRELGNLDFPDGEVPQGELKMALSLIDQLSKPFIAEDWHDTYTEELQDIIEQKTKGKPIQTKGKASQPTDTKDLMQSLKASLNKNK